MIYDGFKAAVAGGVPKEKAGILVDEQFGAAILRDAAAEGFITACPAEKSGQEEFDFEYGEDFARHIEAFGPTFCKVLVRYNPEGDRRHQQAPGGAAAAAVRLSRRQEPQPVHVRVAGAGGEGAARQIEGRQEGLRSGTAAAADGRGDQRNSRTPASSRICGRSKASIAARIARKIVDGGRGPADAMRSAASSSAAAKTTRKFSEWLAIAASVPGFIGFRRRPHEFSGTRWSTGAPRR